MAYSWGLCERAAGCTSFKHMHVLHRLWKRALLLPTLEMIHHKRAFVCSLPLSFPCRETAVDTEALQRVEGGGIMNAGWRGVMWRHGKWVGEGRGFLNGFKAFTGAGRPICICTVSASLPLQPIPWGGEGGWGVGCGPEGKLAVMLMMEGTPCYSQGRGWEWPWWWVSQWMHGWERKGSRSQGTSRLYSKQLWIEEYNVFSSSCLVWLSFERVKCNLIGYMSFIVKDEN